MNAKTLAIVIAGLSLLPLTACERKVEERTHITEAAPPPAVVVTPPPEKTEPPPAPTVNINPPPPATEPPPASTQEPPRTTQ